MVKIVYYFDSYYYYFDDITSVARKVPTIQDKVHSRHRLDVKRQNKPKPEHQTSTMAWTEPKKWWTARRSHNKYRAGVLMRVRPINVQTLGFFPRDF